jgi:hypothetical protein
LVGIYKAIAALPDGNWKTQKLKEVRELITDCSGLWLEAVVRTPYAVRGDSLAISFVMNDRLGSDMVVGKVGVADLDTALNQRLPADRNLSFTRSILVSPQKELTQPYWLAEPMSPGHFNVEDQRLIGDPLSAPSYQANFSITVDGVVINFTRPVQYKYTHPVKGEVYEPLTVLPRATAQFDPELLVFTDGEKKEFDAVVQDRTGHGHPPALGLTPVKELTIGPEGGMRAMDPSWTAKPAGTGTAVVSVDGLFEGNGRKDTAMELRTIAYEHIPRIDYFLPAMEKFTIAGIKTAGHRIGYSPAPGRLYRKRRRRR